LCEFTNYKQPKGLKIYLNITDASHVSHVSHKHDATTSAVDVFTKDFYSLVGEGNTMENL
jgi:hypothetical protein